ncbi:MAG TPA: alpha amylase N-terminal ig-like domain-containing protein, partial [Candidatus Limnocylindrales bacterium]
MADDPRRRLSEAALLHFPDKPFAYGMDRSTLRVVLRAPADALDGGVVLYNDRYAWEGSDYAPLRSSVPLWRYARDGELEYWAADLALHPPRPRYRFGLDDGAGRRWYGYDGLRDTPAPRGAFEFAYVAEGDLPDSPAWARGAVFYHVFPDRF